MNVFSGNLKAFRPGIYRQTDRRNPLGATADNPVEVTVFVDEAYDNNWQSEMVSQTSDVLIYAQPASVLGSKSCVGGTIEVNQRRFRIDSFALATNQRTGQITHVELGATEI